MTVTNYARDDGALSLRIFPGDSTLCCLVVEDNCRDQLACDDQEKWPEFPTLPRYLASAVSILRCHCWKLLRLATLATFVRYSSSRAE